MIEHTQTILQTPENESAGIVGNCWQAAVACLLDLHLDEVPHFAAFWKKSEEAYRLFLASRKLRVIEHEPDAPPSGYSIMIGRSPRRMADGAPMSHCVIALDGKMIWDPHPSRAGIEWAQSFETIVEESFE